MTGGPVETAAQGPMPDLGGPIGAAAQAIHAGCGACDGHGTVTDDMGGGHFSYYPCERLTQLEDLLAEAFTAAHASGWRIVRTEDVGYRACLRGGGPGEGTGWRVHPAFSLHMSGCYPVAAITDEWEPACPGDQGGDDA